MPQLYSALPPAALLLRPSQGLYRSKDAGENWQLVNKSQPLLWPKDFTVHPKNSREIYIGACDIRDGEPQGGL